MNTIDLAQPIKDATGKEAKENDGSPLFASKFIREALAADQNSGFKPLKVTTMINSINENEGKLEIDDADLETLKQWIDRTNTMTPLVRGRILEIINQK